MWGQQRSEKLEYYGCYSVGYQTESFACGLCGRFRVGVCKEGKARVEKEGCVFTRWLTLFNPPLLTLLKKSYIFILTLHFHLTPFLCFSSPYRRHPSKKNVEEEGWPIHLL